MPPSGKSPEKSFTGEDPDTRDLRYDTLLDLATSSEISPEDREKAEKSIEFRNKMGITGDDDNEDIDTETDLTKHDYLIEDGEVYYPTDKLREFREQNLQGPIPREWRETLKDRAKKTTDAVIKGSAEIATNPESEIISATPEEKAKLVIENTSRITLEEYNGGPKFPSWLIKKCSDDVKRRESDFTLQDNSSKHEQSIFEVASEPLIAYILNGTGKRDGFFPDQTTTARWASKYDDFFRNTDVVFCIKDTSKTKLGWITYSVDVTTAASNDKNDKTGVAGKFSDATYPDSTVLKTARGKERAPTPWTNEIVFCKSGNYKYSEEYAPHFVLGLSRDNFSQIFSEMTIDKSGAILDCPLSDEVSFMITSEFFEEVNMQRANITDKESVRYKQIATLRKMAMDKLNNLLGVEPGDSAALKEKYLEKSAEMAQKDPVYALIVAYSKKQKKKYISDHNGQ
ncbi:hypothetical protein IKD57_01545 [Candidatus Saccharibacteria bacterium]|nr:hypothetical protein [Candidatus Saccharibacteria bacterium]